MNYKWKSKSMVKADPSMVGVELESLRQERDGYIQPKDVVECAARDEGSELYKCFEWDDTIAADKYRIEQAKLVMRAIVKVVDTGEEVVEVRCFESVQMECDDQKQHYYVSTTDALTDDDMKEQVLDEIKDAISELRHKLKIYNKFIGGGEKVIRLLDHVEKELVVA